MTKPRILVFAGSLRTGSFNERLAGWIARELAAREADVTHISLRDYPMPLYDADMEAREGQPESARRLGRLLLEHQGCFIVTPEYNAGTTPLLKNTIDWTSRVKPAELGGAPFKGRVFALGAASDGPRAGYRALIHLRHVMELGLGALVQPEMISVGGAGSAFDDAGNLKDERTAGFARGAVDALVAHAGRFA